jgi:hypothetical protein
MTMIVLIWILRIVVILFILRLLLHTLFPRQMQAPRPGGRQPAKRRERIGGALVRDPHCGTYIPKSRAIVVGAGANAQHFCSAECRDAHAAR